MAPQPGTRLARFLLRYRVRPEGNSRIFGVRPANGGSPRERLACRVPLKWAQRLD